MSAPERGNDITPPERSDAEPGEAAGAAGTPNTPPSMTEPFPGGSDAAAAAIAAGSFVEGTAIGRYQVKRIVGAGGVGLVIAAHDAELGRSVAIKLLAREHADARARLMREAQAMAKLSHPNVVTVHEVVRVGDRAGIVMELIDGQDLAAWRAAAPRTWREVVAVYVQAARGLAAAHRAGLVHRDFKPANALIDRDGLVRVTDFGLVHAAEPGDSAATDATLPAERVEASTLDPLLTRTGAVLGTPAYMAPEQHRGDPVDARTDQWALACSLWGTLYGQRPFAGETFGALSATVLGGKLRPEPSEPAVPPRIRAAIRRALALRPADRFATMDDLIAALTPPRRTWPIVVGVGGAVAAAAVIAIVATRDSNAGATCADVDAPLTAVWNPSRAQALRDHFAAAHLPFGDAAASHVVTGLDAYGSAWTAARTAACVQHRQGVESSEQLARRVGCLDQRVVEVGALVGGLIDATPATIRVAGDAVEALHPVGDCADARDTVPRPADAQARADIAAAETALARAYALVELAEFAQARPLAADAAAVGERTGWTPLTARALMLLGQCQSREDASNDAIASYDKAATAAAQAHDDSVVADALSSKFFELGNPLGKPAEALAMRSFVEIALERAGNPWRVRALWLHNLAIILLDQTKYDDALAAETDAIALWRANLPNGHYRLVDSLETLANIEIYRKQYDHAVALYAEALAAATATHGESHPKVASIIMNQGVLEAQRGDLAAAVTYWQKSMAIDDAAGSKSWITRYNIGVGTRDLGRWQAAIAPLSEALELAEAKAPGETMQVASVADALAPALASIGELDRAGELIARAVRAGRAAGVPVVQDALAWTALIAIARGDLPAARAAIAEAKADKGDPGSANALADAELARATGDCKTAATAYQRAIELATSEPSESNITAATFGLGACQVTTGAAADAVTAVGARLAWLAKAGADPGATAEGQFVLAQAVIATGGDAARAHALAQDARTGFATLGAPGAKRAAVVDGWLRRH